MRRRRAERCILRAEVAAEAGCLEDARAALEEARKLAPGLPEIATVEASIFGKAAALEQERRTRWMQRLLYAAAVIGGVAVLSIGVILWQRAAHPIAPAEPAVSRPAVAPSTAVSKPILRQVSRDVRVETIAVTAMLLGSMPIAPPADSPTLEAKNDVEEAAPAVTRAVGTRDPEPEPDPAPAPAAPPVRPALNRLDDMAVEPVSPLAREAATPALREAEVDTAPAALNASNTAAVPLTPTPPKIDDSNAVRSVLHRYADAYSRLDASAAQQVWPRVNRAALSRAFEGLASQDITLRNCSVDVNGASARAICEGEATWAPKIGGGGPRTQPRSWTFQLAKAGSDWQIVNVNARVQNR